MNELDKLRFTTFTTTGHETLKALLFVSGGASALFMAFFGTFFGSRIALAEALPANVQSLADATIYFLLSVSVCMLAYGMTFLSHFAFYKHWTRSGTVLMVITGLLGITSLCSVVVACIKVIDGIQALMGGVA